MVDLKISTKKSAVLYSSPIQEWHPISDPDLWLTRYSAFESISANCSSYSGPRMYWTGMSSSGFAWSSSRTDSCLRRRPKAHLFVDLFYCYWLWHFHLYYARTYQASLKLIAVSPDFYGDVTGRLSLLFRSYCKRQFWTAWANLDRQRWPLGLTL